MRQHHAAFHDNSIPTTARKFSVRRFAFVAFFDMCGTSCPIGKLPFSFLLCEEFRKAYFLSMPQLSKYVSIRPGELEGFERCFKVKDQGTWRRQNLHAAILRPPAERIQILKAL